MKIIHGQPSWRIASADVEAYVTELGGHLAPVTYDRRGRKFTPLAIAPWSAEPIDSAQPPVLRVMRGDFFCLPFGGNETPFREERHPPHGETANSRWTFERRHRRQGRTTLHLSLNTKIRLGRVDKYISVREGEPAVYCRHVISAMSGRMNLGHHAILKFPAKPGSGLISTSPFKTGQVFVKPVERPENRGYSALLPGAKFTSLEKVPTIFGHETDLSRYPARRGYEDIVMLTSDPELPFAWTAVAFPEQRYVWFALKNPRVLRQTLLWISNGGRHYPPWNGRHCGVMGLEEITSYFHTGLAESTRTNSTSAKGFPTSLSLHPKRPLTINYIMSAVPVPNGFDSVASIQPYGKRDKIQLISASGKKVQVPIQLSFLMASDSRFSDEVV